MLCLPSAKKMHETSFFAGERGEARTGGEGKGRYSTYIIITMIILLLNDSSQTVIRKLIIKNQPDVVFPLPKKGLGVIAVGVVVLESIRVVVEGVRDTRPLGVRVITVSFEPDPVSDVLLALVGIRIREEFYRGPFPIVGVTSILYLGC